MKNSSSLPSSCHPLLDLFRCSLLSVAIVVAPRTNAQFNVYHPFPDSNAVWGMGAGCTDWNCGTYRYVQDYIAGDTVIDGNAYKNIGQSVSIDYEGCSCTIPEDLGEGFLREDTAARKVYWRFPGSTADTLLYDFTLELGDTLRGLYGNSGMCSSTVFTVQSIDSVPVGSSYRKRINFTSIDFDSCSPTSIIEGVGSTTGLTTCYATPTSFAIRLDCFTVGDSLFYLAPCGTTSLACGNLPSGVSDGAGFADKLIAFHPNPTAGIMKLVCHFSQPSLDLLIYDVTGKAVYRNHISQEQSTIDITALGKGIYMALVFQSGVLIRAEKLVKQ